MIGRSVGRLEDLALVSGRGRFAADVDLVGQLHMRVVRSPVAAGTLHAVDVAVASEVPGVAAVWTAVDVADVPLVDFRQVGFRDLLPYRQPVLARDRVRYVGEPVGVVFACDPYVAEDAADTVQLDIESEPCVTSTEDPPPPWGEGLSTEAMYTERGYGDVASAFARAAHVVEVAVSVGRHTGVPLECRGALAQYDELTGRLTVYGAAKVPFYNRNAIAAMIGLPPSRVILSEGHVGGGFGIRGELYPEDVLVALAAYRLRAPVKWIEDRREHLLAANHSRDQRHTISAAVDADGVVLAIDDEFWADQGAYVRTHGATVSMMTAAMLPGPYRVPAYRSRAHIRMTNKTPAGTYRAPGRYEGTFARERLMDAIAAELHIDAVELRRRNFIAPEDMPFPRDLDALGTKVVYDSGKYELLLDKALRCWEVASVAETVARRRAAGERVGVGIACFVEKSGLGPYEGVEIKVDSEGAVEVVTGAASVGQGIETVVGQIVADTLGVEYAGIRVVHGQTDRFDYGMGAFASRLTVMAGSATLRAAEKVREKAMLAAGDLLEIEVNDLVFEDGSVSVKGSPSRSVSLAEAAAHLTPVNAARLGTEPGLSAQGWFLTDHMNYPYGVHLALVSVECDTGAVHAERYLVAYDIGRAINPAMVEGQLVGGAFQGLGGALLEDFQYGTDGQPLSATFMDYLLPTLHDFPAIEVLVTEDAPSPLNPLGVKGAGEGGTTAAGAAVAAAIDDALGRPLAIRSLPVTPEMVRALLRQGDPSPSA